MAELIASSRAVIYNSSYEGFGLPPIEAWGLGTPAVYPDISPLSENLAGIPGAFTPSSYDSFARALTTVLGLSDGAVANYQSWVRARFDWTDCADRIVTAAIDAYLVAQRVPTRTFTVEPSRRRKRPEDLDIEYPTTPLEEL